jgi:hypothetical protein
VVKYAALTTPPRAGDAPDGRKFKPPCTGRRRTRRGYRGRCIPLFASHPERWDAVIPYPTGGQPLRVRAKCGPCKVRAPAALPRSECPTDRPGCMRTSRLIFLPRPAYSSSRYRSARRWTLVTRRAKIEKTHSPERSDSSTKRTRVRPASCRCQPAPTEDEDKSNRGWQRERILLAVAGMSPYLPNLLCSGVSPSPTAAPEVMPSRASDVASSPPWPRTARIPHEALFGPQTVPPRSLTPLRTVRP